MQKPSFKRRVLVALGWLDPQLVRSIGQCARDAGWHLEMRHFFNECIPEGWRGDGLIVSHSPRPDLADFIRRQAAHQATVLIYGTQPGIVAPQVVEDNFGAGRLAAWHFIEQGHKQFAWLGDSPDQVETDRLGGFRAALNTAGYDCHILKPPAQQPLEEQLRALPGPVACYAMDDLVASELIETCLVIGLRVPEDIAIIGTGNIQTVCECSHVPISSVDTAVDEIARAAVTLLDRLMDGEEPPKEPLVIPPRGVVLRQSSEFLALTDAALKKAVRYVTEHLESAPSLDAIAHHAGVSRRTLYHLFRRDLHRTPAEFIHHIRFVRAKQLLAAPETNIAEAAKRCGYGSARTLCRQFSLHEGVTARDWKKYWNSSH